MIKKTNTPIHPGRIIDKVINNRNITRRQLAKATGLPIPYVHSFLGSGRRITLETSCIFAKALSCKPDYWYQLQIKYDLANLLTTKKMKQAMRKVKVIKRK